MIHFKSYPSTDIYNNNYIYNIYDMCILMIRSKYSGPISGAIECRLCIVLWCLPLRRNIIAEDLVNQARIVIAYTHQCDNEYVIIKSESFENCK